MFLAKSKKKFHMIMLLAFILLFSSCATSQRKGKDYYIVKSGDTLYSIAKKHNIMVTQLANLNKINSPYVIHHGRKLALYSKSRAPAPSLQVAKHKATKNNEVVKPKLSRIAIRSPNHTIVVPPIPARTSISWMWPVKGKILQKFKLTPGALKSNGIDIVGLMGTPILAAATGKVVYVGNSLKGYGNLIIIKHNENFLSAYAHNQKILVAEHDLVKIGQQIATMGNTDSKVIKLHFEIRYKGKPVDPLKFLIT